MRGGRVKVTDLITNLIRGSIKMSESEVQEIILNGVEERRDGDTKDFNHCDVLCELFPIRREGALLVEHHAMT